MSVTKQSRRSPRLMEKEAFDKIATILETAKIPIEWVFRDDLFTKRWQYEQLLKSYESVRGYYCRCDDCSYEQKAKEEEYTDYLPFNNYTKDDVVEPISELLALSASCGRKEMKIIYCTAIMRLIHGPARCLLKYDNFRAVTKAQCSSLPQQAIDHGLTDTPFGERLLDACWAVAELIAEYEDEDGYNIFHGF